MGRPAKQVIERLGLLGLTRALDDLLDQEQLVRLANACGLKYPGMRTQSQSRKRLLADLSKRAATNASAGQAILRTLEKETTEAARGWSELDPAEKVKRLCDRGYLASEGHLGLHLYLLASDGSDLEAFGNVFAREHLLQIASAGPQEANGDGEVPRSEERLKRKISELLKKVHHLDGQVARSRETQKTFQRDLIQRKGELAESRMLVERLRRDLAAARDEVQSATARTASKPVPVSSVEELAPTLRKLSAEQRKLAHAIAKLPLEPRAPTTLGSATLSPLVSSIDKLGTEVAAQRVECAKALAEQSRRLAELRSEVRSRAEQRPSRRARPRGEAKRVGVFIDVQNMYYSARQLKGKLDFDALLEAAVQNRRLVEATAYVVESNETDQSQFIAMLQNRGIKVQRKALRIRADGSMKGDWDMELALDILDAAPKLDVVVLVSGDGDFTSLVKRVKKMGPRVEVIAFPRNTAKALAEACDHYQPLDRKFMIYTKGAKPAGVEVEPASPAAVSGGPAGAEPIDDRSRPHARKARGLPQG